MLYLQLLLKVNFSFSRHDFNSYNKIINYDAKFLYFFFWKLVEPSTLTSASVFFIYFQNIVVICLGGLSIFSFFTRPEGVKLNEKNKTSHVGGSSRPK